MHVHSFINYHVPGIFKLIEKTLSLRLLLLYLLNYYVIPSIELINL